MDQNLFIGFAVFVALLLTALLVRRRNATTRRDEPTLAPERDKNLEQRPHSPPAKSLEELAQALISQLDENDARALADKADEALDNGAASMTVEVVSPGAAPERVSLPAVFLEVLLDMLVERYPDLQEIIDAPRGASVAQGRRSVGKPSGRTLPRPLATGLSRSIALVYEDAAGNETERDVTIRRVLGEDPMEPEYLVGVCHMRRALRHFRLDRVVEITDHETGEVINELRAIVAWSASLVAEGRPKGRQRYVAPVQESETPAGAWQPLPDPDLATSHRVLRFFLRRSVLVSHGDERTPGVFHVQAVIGGKSGALQLYGRWEPWGNMPRRIRLSAIRALTDPTLGETLNGPIAARAWADRLVSDGP